MLIWSLPGVTPLMAASIPVYGDLPGVVFPGTVFPETPGVPPDYSFTNLNTFDSPFLLTWNGAYSGALFDDSPETPGDLAGGGNTLFASPDPVLLLQTSVGSVPGDFQMTSNQAVSPDELGGPATLVPEPRSGFMVWCGIIAVLVMTRRTSFVGNTS